MRRTLETFDYRIGYVREGSWLRRETPTRVTATAAKTNRKAQKARAAVTIEVATATVRENMRMTETRKNIGDNGSGKG